MSLAERFASDDSRLAIQAMLEQHLVAGDPKLAERVVFSGSLEEFPVGTILTRQGDFENDLFFILVGEVQVTVNGRTVARRASGTHIGEMAAIEVSQPRAATVTALSDTLCVRLAEPAFSQIASEYPEVWRRIAKQLAKRLEQRNALVPSTHDKIKVFIMSSLESLDVARAVQSGLQFDNVLAVVWTDGVFKSSAYPLESLEAQLDNSDFAIAIAHADDQATVRGREWPVPRDNVIFELGFFMGRIGRKRSILVESRADQVKLPSDLAGLTTLSYMWSGERNDLPAAVAPICNSLRNLFADLGPNN